MTFSAQCAQDAGPNWKLYNTVEIVKISRVIVNFTSVLLYYYIGVHNYYTHVSCTDVLYINKPMRNLYESVEFVLYIQ